MANKRYDNDNTVAIWKKVAKSGNEYYSGIIYVGSVPYTITLFDNEAADETKPVLKGKIELREAR